MWNTGVSVSKKCTRDAIQSEGVSCRDAGLAPQGQGDLGSPFLLSKFHNTVHIIIFSVNMKEVPEVGLGSKGERGTAGWVV